MTTPGDALDRSRPPTPGPVRPFALPRFERATLDNGLRIVSARADHVPLAQILLLLPAGGHATPPGAEGLPSLHAALLDEGTTRRSSLDIARTMDALGGTFMTGADWEVAAIGAGVLTEHTDEAMAMIAEVARQPSFPDDEIERLRQQRLTELQRRRDQPATLAQRAFTQAIYRDTVYGELMGGNRTSVERLDRDTIVAFWKRHVSTTGATLIAAGAIDLDKVERLARTWLGDWSAGTPITPPTIEPPPRDGVTVTIVDRPAAPQTQLQIGHASVSRQTPGHLARTVTNAILGGSFTSRLNLEIRERRGLTYGIRSSFVRRSGPAPFLVRTALTTEGTGDAVDVIVHEMNRLRDEVVPTKELRGVIDYMVGVFPYTAQSIGDLARKAEDLVVYDLPDDHFETYPARLAAITADDVCEAARAHLHPEQVAVVAVGPAESLRSQLEHLGPVDVITA